MSMYAQTKVLPCQKGKFEKQDCGLVWLYWNSLKSTAGAQRVKSSKEPSWKGRPATVFLTIKWHEIHLFLSLFARIYVCIGQKYSKVMFSLLNYIYWPSMTRTPSQSSTL